MSAFGQRIREARLAMGWRLVDISDATGISLSFISDMEQGRRRPPKPDRVVSLADALGISREELMVLALRERQPEILKIKQERDEATARAERAEAVICDSLAHMESIANEHRGRAAEAGSIADRDFHKGVTSGADWSVTALLMRCIGNGVPHKKTEAGDAHP